MTEPIRVVVVDDEAPARVKVRRLLAGDDRFELAGEARDGLEAIALVERLHPELMVLDIQMPGLTGFEVLEELRPPRPQVVFSTALDHHALEAFAASAVDYLLKPYDKVRFQRALDRVVAMRGHVDVGLQTLVQRVAKAPLERLLVEGERGLEALPLRRILRLEAQGKWVRIHTEGGIFDQRRSLKDLEARLPLRCFCRVHRSTLVSLEAVVRLEPWDHGDGLLILKDGSHCVLSRTYRSDFLARWGLET